MARFRPSDRPASLQRGRGFMVAVGLLGLSLVVLMMVIAFNSPNSIPGRSYYTVQAAFSEADNLTPHSQVRLGGKLIGQVLKPRVSDDGEAVVDLQLDPEFGPLPADSQIEVRPRSPVGVRYVDIRPGTSSETIADGERFPIQQTSATTPLDQVLLTFDDKTQGRTRDFLQGLGGGLAGRGMELNESLVIAPDMLRGTKTVLGAVNDRTGATEGLIRGGNRAATAVDPVRVPLGEGFRPQADALAPFSDRRASTQGLLREAPPTLDTLEGRLPQVDRMLREVRGLAAELRPALQAGPVAFTETSALFNDAGPSLRRADDVLQLAEDATDPTLDLLSTVRPVLPRLEQGLADATPLVARLGRYGCDIVDWGKNWSSMVGFGNDAGGGALRFLLVSPGIESGFGLGNAVDGNELLSNRDNPYPEPCTAGKIPLD